MPGYDRPQQAGTSVTAIGELIDTISDMSVQTPISLAELSDNLGALVRQFRI
ncbi:hypothetical protein [Pseudomonas sp. EA_35y_Pfl2_R5]|uniref:hypothetical protein n=1 Tax=Pseudomonas sp. EA_35y_Pfl2_R5 TaxID=3088690 RepID=UPI0030DA9F8C